MIIIVQGNSAPRQTLGLNLNASLHIIIKLCISMPAITYIIISNIHLPLMNAIFKA